MAATVVEDIVTLGVGIADDPVSFAVTAAMTQRSLMLLKGVQVSTTRLGLIASHLHTRASLKIKIFVREQGSTARRAAVYKTYTRIRVRSYAQLSEKKAIFRGAH